MRATATATAGMDTVVDTVMADTFQVATVKATAGGKYRVVTGMEEATVEAMEVTIEAATTVKALV